ncbi:MAG: AAA family ATPase [Candidatus Acidiferrum sp.]
MSTIPPSSIPGWKLCDLNDALAGTPKPPWVIEGLLPKQSAHLVAAHPHSLKSLSWLQACIEAAAPAHKTVWGHFPAPDVKNTLFIETEDPGWMVEERIRGIAKGLGLSSLSDASGFRYIAKGPMALLNEEKNLQALIQQNNTDFFILSTLQNMLGPGRSLKDDEDMQPISAMVLRLAQLCPGVLLTHSPWDKRQKRAAGTVTLAANFLTTSHFEKIQKGRTGETFVHVLLDSKAGATETDFTLRLETDAGEVRKVVYVCAGRPKGFARDDVRDAIAADPSASNKEIAERAGVSARYVRRIREEQAEKEAMPSCANEVLEGSGKDAR